jgi:hypothetical protein
MRKHLFSPIIGKNFDHDIDPSGNDGRLIYFQGLARTFLLKSESVWPILPTSAGVIVPRYAMKSVFCKVVKIIWVYKRTPEHISCVAKSYIQCQNVNYNLVTLVRLAPGLKKDSLCVVVR